MEGLRTPLREGQLVRRLIEQGIRDPRVLAAFARVPRRFFVPDEAQPYSEGDHPLEIGYGQTISQPYIVAAMTEALQLEGRERVLEVGTGSGYQTAILCELLPLASTVRTIEIVPELSGRAERTLKELGYENVEFRVGDGASGWPEGAPYDAILVAAAPEEVPAPLLEQLSPGGRLVIPVGPDPEHQELQLWHKLPVGGGVDRKILMHVRFVPLTGHSRLH
ncbi:MAG: protein-L-isoaspartate(D-aspartate) O-methyltransferase [Deltaproteobacteria bacterium]|nr:MAG: protein-L-isoaspartate(D-aspartate) O-methyltransferase [Deltaproteobacteria bacterium]